jgi:ABC-type lipoprotein release transport system permease subunit
MDVVFRMAWRNLWRNRRRTLLTAGAIAFSTVLLLAWVPIQFGAYELMIDYSLRVFPGHAQIQRPGYQDEPQMRKTIPDAESLAGGLRNSGLYTGVSVRAQGFALISSETRSYGGQVVGVQPEFERSTSTIPGLVTQGRFLSSIDASEIVLGSALARNLKVKPGDEITILGAAKDGSVAANILPVVGIFESGSNEIDRFFTLMPLHSFQDTFGMRNEAHVIAVVGRSVDEQPQLLAALRKAVLDRKDVTVLGWEQLMPGLKEGIQVDKVSGFIFLGILVAVVVFSILNTFLMSVLERTREFGLMLALGSRPRRLAGLMMLESLLLTLLGLMVGIIIGSMLVYWAHVAGFGYPGLEEIAKQYNIPISRIYPQLNPFNFLLGPTVVLVATNLASWIPILRLRKLEPVEAMRTI